jgi:hypothetical protein
MNPIAILSSDEIREILVKRVDQQKQAVGIVAGVIEPNGPRVVAYGHLASAIHALSMEMRSSKSDLSPRSSLRCYWRIW